MRECVLEQCLSRSVPRSPAPALHCWCTSAAASPPALYCAPAGFYPARLPSADLRQKHSTISGDLRGSLLFLFFFFFPVKQHIVYCRCFSIRKNKFWLPQFSIHFYWAIKENPPNCSFFFYFKYSVNLKGRFKKITVRSSNLVTRNLCEIILLGSVGLN